MDKVELLIGLAEIAIALAGFTGVVVAFGSRSHGSWAPGDRLRLTFLLEASLTGASFSLLALLAIYLSEQNGPMPPSFIWPSMSGLWALYMVYSTWSARQKIKENAHEHQDVDKWSNRVTGLLFWLLIILQIANLIWWGEFGVFLAALLLNLAGAAMQFARLLKSAFHS